MTDKQLAMLLKQYAGRLSLISDDIKDELVKSKKFRKEHPPIFGNTFYTAPVLEELESFIEDLNNNAELLALERER